MFRGRFVMIISMLVMLLTITYTQLDTSSMLLEQGISGIMSQGVRKFSFKFEPQDAHPLEPSLPTPGAGASGDPVPRAQNDTAAPPRLNLALVTQPPAPANPTFELPPARKAEKVDEEGGDSVNKSATATVVGDRAGGGGQQAKDATPSPPPGSPASPLSPPVQGGNASNVSVGSLGSAAARASDRGTREVQIGQAKDADAAGGAKEGRWRGNQYIRNGGILPYGVCGSEGDRRQPGLDLSVKLGGKSWGFTTLAANVWGESDETGKPTGARHVQLLFYYQQQGKICTKMRGNPYLHCVLPNNELTFECRIGEGEWQEAWFRGKRDIKDPSVAQDMVHCNFTQGAWADELKDKFTVELRVKDFDGKPVEEKSSLKVDVCYMHVERVWPLVICTEPMYGMSLDSGFWFNHEWQRNNSFSVLDEFVTYHIMQGVKVQVHDHDGSLNMSMNRYKGNPAVAYRRGWSIPALNHPASVPNKGATAYETHAETACMWEHRFRAKWMQILHAADNFAFPTKPNMLIADVANKLDLRNIHTVYVPACVPSSPLNPERPPTSLIERFALQPDLRKCVNARKERFTPFGDPRSSDSTNVHWFTAFRDHFNASLMKRPVYATEEMGYYTVHIMGMSKRSGMDNHKGLKNSKWNELHGLLKQHLDKLGPLPADTEGGPHNESQGRGG